MDNERNKLEVTGRLCLAIMERDFEAICQLETELAELLDPGTLQGDVARRGSVRAAISAGNRELAKQLAKRWSEEPGASPRVVESVTELLECWHLPAAEDTYRRAMKLSEEITGESYSVDEEGGE